jgi:CBS domain-containing protein
MLVSLYMSPEPVTVGPRDDLAVAARLMARRSIRTVPVVDEGRLVGILSRSDLLHALPLDVHPFSAELQAGRALGVRVADVMAQGVKTVRPDDPIEHAVAMLDEHRLSCLVVERDGEVVGVLSRSDILHAFRRMVFRDGAARFSLLVAAGVDVVALAARRGVVVAYAEHEHDAGRLVTLAFDAPAAEVDALLAELHGLGARVLHRASPDLAV